MRLTAEAVIKALLVADCEAGRLLVMKRAACFPFMARFLQLGRAQDNARKRHPRTEFVKPLRRKRPSGPLLAKRGFHQTAGFAHVEFCPVA